MANFNYLCSFPVYCRSCGTMSTANLLAGLAKPPKPKSQSSLQNLKNLLSGLFQQSKQKTAEKQMPRCGNCNSADLAAYDSEELMQVKGKAVVTWNVKEKLGRILVLTDGKYLCPSCKKFEMTFEAGTLCWD